jgi:6-phosphogluconolactonase
MNRNTPLDCRFYPTTIDAAKAAANYLAQHCRTTLMHQERVSIALSGGRTPWFMLDELCVQDMAFDRLDVLQVDERIVSLSDDRLNAAKIREHLVDKHPNVRFYAMPVDKPQDVMLHEYSKQFTLVCNGRLDVICLGLGADAHTASLVPGDPLVNNQTDLLGISQEYQQTHRLTLLRKPINAARLKIWLVTGSDKQSALQQLIQKDTSVPAGHIDGPGIVFADKAACPT